VSEEQAKFEPTFNIRLISSTLREVMIFLINRQGLINTAEHFWQAQQDVMLLKQELETAYKSGIQKAQQQKRTDVTELWMFGLLAYQRLTEDGLSLKAFLEMPYARMERQAAELGKALMKRAEAEGELVYLFEKKSRDKSE
jgi:hypothetical protein